MSISTSKNRYHTAERRARHSATSQESRANLWAKNPNRLCPPDHKHGLTLTCVKNHGCQCEPCLNHSRAVGRKREWETRLVAGKGVLVDATGSRRRLEALAYMGWSSPEIARRVGTSYRPILKIRYGEHPRVTLSNHRRIAKVFRELCLIEAPGRSGEITRGYARKRGYHSPMAWDNIDDINETPKTRGATNDKASMDHQH